MWQLVGLSFSQAFAISYSLLILARYFSTFSLKRVNGPCLLDYLILKLRLPVVLYVSFAVVSR